MKLGISLYPGLDANRAKSLLLLQKAAALGYSRVFSSLHIPESNAASLREDALYLFACAESLGLDVIADISPLTLKILDIPELTPARLKQLHITTARFDYGIGTESLQPRNEGPAKRVHRPFRGVTCVIKGGGGFFPHRRPA